MEATEHPRLACAPEKKHPPLHLWKTVFLFAPLIAIPIRAVGVEPPKGIAPFANYIYTYDSNLLNRSEEGDGERPQSDQVNRLEAGALFDFEFSRQRFSGLLSLSDTRHQRFTQRNTDGNAHRLRWDSEIGKTVTASVEASSVSDQAPIQTGQAAATQREQDGASASLTWSFHPNYAVLSQYANNDTRFTGPGETADAGLAGLNRDDQSSYVGLAYRPFTGSSAAILFKQSNGFFPSRQLIAPDQSVSNNFDQKETELLTKWSYSELTALTFSLSSVNRQHDELQTRDYSGTNYRLEVFYRPTQKTNVNLVWGKQIIGISDVTNSDALAKQLGIAMNMELTSKLVFHLAYSPQELQFNGTDGLGAGTGARTERLKEGRAGLEFELDPKLTLGANLRKRSRDSTLVNTDYSAESMNIFIRYEH